MIKYLRSHFAGPIIANSAFYVDDLIKAGCSHRCGKEQLVSTVIQVLKEIHKLGGTENL